MEARNGYPVDGFPLWRTLSGIFGLAKLSAEQLTLPVEFICASLVNKDLFFYAYNHLWYNDWTLSREIQIFQQEVGIGTNISMN